MYAKTGKRYEQSLMFSGDSVRDSAQANTLYVKLNNEGNDTGIQVGVKDEYRFKGTLISRKDEKIDVEIKSSTKQDDDFNFKLSYNNDRIFDGWFYLTRMIRRFAREHIPAWIERQLSTAKDSHQETLRILSQYV